MIIIRAIILLIIIPVLAFANDFDELVETHIKAHSKFKDSNKLIAKLNKTNPDKKDEYLKLVHQAIHSFTSCYNYYKKAGKDLSREIEDNHDYDDHEFNELIKIQETMKAEKDACRTTLENLNNILSTEKALPLKNEALKKLEAANGITFPAKTLRQEAEYLQAYEEVKKLYEEAIELLSQAAKHLSDKKLKSLKDSLLKDVDSIKQSMKQQNEQKNAWQKTLQGQKDALRKKIEPLENEVQAYSAANLTQMAYEVNNELLDILTLLSKTQNDLQDKKAASLEYKDAFLKLRDTQRITTTPWSDVKESKAEEDKRRALFYANDSSYQLQNLSDISCSQTLCVTPLDTQKTIGLNDFVMHLDSTYRFALQHVDSVSEIVVAIFDDAVQVATIAIPIPSPHVCMWDYYVLQEGFVHTPENELLQEYGLDLSVRLHHDEHSKTNVVISQKAASTKYAFTVSCNDELAYRSTFVEPLPYQLDALTKPIYDTFVKSYHLVSRGIAALQPSNSQIEACAFLDELVSQLKADPLALAMYVHNEIANTQFSVYLDNIYYKAESIVRCPTRVFLEKCGSCWEQCQLLVYLLQKAGYDAHYVSDAIQFCDKTTFENLFFVTADASLDTVLAMLPGVTFRYNNEWVTLYPWMKEIEVTEGYNLYQFFPKKYASAEKWLSQYLKNDEDILKAIGTDGDDTVGTLFGLFASSELRKKGLTIDDVGISHKIVKKQFGSFSDFPQLQVVSIPQTTASLDKTSDLFTKAKIELKSHKNANNAISYAFALADLRFDTLNIECSDQIQVEKKRKKSKKKHKPKQTIVTCVKTQFLGKEQNLYLDQSDDVIDVTLTIYYKDAPYTETKQISKGSKAAVCLHSGTHSEALTRVFYKQFLDQNDDAKRIQALLSYISFAYFEKCGRAQNLLAKLHKVNPGTRVMFGISLLCPTQNNDLVTPQVDMTYLEIPSYLHDPSAFVQYAALNIADSSSNEHQILKEVFKDRHAVSTVKLLQLAHAKAQKSALGTDGFLALTGASFDRAEITPDIKQAHAGQYAIAKDALVNPFSYAYMTPGNVANLNSTHNEMASLIVSPRHTYALISTNVIAINGGLGTPMSKEYVRSSNFKQNFEAYQKRYSNPPKLPHQIYKADTRSGYKPSWNAVADPIDVVTGAFYIDETDMDLPFGLAIRRNYNSQNPQESNIGIGWKLSLNPYLVKQDNKIFAAEADGTVIAYTYNAHASRWEVSLEDNPELTNFGGKNTLSAYIIDDVLYSPDGTKRIYKDGLLTKIISASGLELIFSYDNRLLTRIETSNGQYCGFCYNHSDKIIEIYAQDGRRVHYTYNNEGELVKVTLPNTAEICYEYDRLHQIIRETKPHGNVVENIYNDEGKVVEQRSPSGFRQELVTTATFIYADNETTVVDACGGTSVYKIYQKQIYKIVDPLGAITLKSWFIDASTYFDAESEQVVAYNADDGYAKSLKKSTDKRGLTTEYFYDKNGNVARIRMSGDDLTGDGVTSIDKTFTYNSLNLCIEECVGSTKTQTIYDSRFAFLACRQENYVNDTLTSYVEYTYNDKGQIEKEDKSGAITLWKYNTAGFAVEKVQQSATDDPDVITTYSYNYQGQCVESKTHDAHSKTVYDIAGNAVEMHVLSLSGKIISSIYNAYDLNNRLIRTQTANSDNVVYMDYNAAGQIKALRQELAPTQLMAYSLYEYDARGYLTEETNPLGYVTKRAYDALGNTTATTNGDITLYQTYEKGGLEASTEIAGVKTVRTYTANGLVAQEIYADNTELSRVYDILGRLVQETKDGICCNITYDDIQHTVTRESLVKEVYRYDMRGNVIAFTDAAGYVWKKSYDGLDRLISESAPSGETTYWSYNGDTVTATLPNNETIITRYAAGQIVETATYDKEQTCLYHKTINYDPVLDIETIAEGDITTITHYNNFGQPVSVLQGDILTRFEYDKAGNCIRIIDGNGNITSKDYDSHNRLISKTLADKSTYYYNYDALSNITSCILPNGGVWCASYDSMCRKRSEEFVEKGISHGRYEYIYSNGTLIQKIDPMKRVHSYTYDALQRLTQVEADGWLKRYEYDARGLMTAGATCSPKRETTYVARVYDSSARLINEKTYLNSKIIQDSDQVWEYTDRTLRVGDHERKFSYANNRLIKLASHNVELTYKYNKAGRLEYKASPYTTTAISYSLAGLPEHITTTHPKDTLVENMSWTKAGKLQGYHSSKQDKDFSYTARGFFAQGAFDINATRMSYDNHKVLDNGVDSFGKVTAELLDHTKIRSSYNAMGELTSSNNETYKWDPWGQLLEVHASSSTWSAVYDAFGRRLETVHTQIGYIYSSTVVTTAFFDPEKEFEEIGIQLHDKTFWKYFGPDYCDAVSDNTNDSAYLIHNSLHQLEAVVTNNSVSYPEHYPTPYGPQKQSDVFYDLVTYAQTLAWHSQAQDPTGLIWMGKRYYNPKCGRFISCDPIALPTNTNLYTYAKGDPINNTDPDGRFASPVYKPVPQTTIHTRRESPGFWQSIKNTSSHYYNRALAACTVDNALDAMDQVSLALMLVPSGHVKLAGAGIGVISKAARFTRSIFSKPVRNAVKPITEFGANYIVRSSPKAHKAAKSTMDVAKKAWQFDNDYVNLASDTATHHIIFGEGLGSDLGGHLWPAIGKKTPFPSQWSPGKIMDIVSDIATDPNLVMEKSLRPPFVRNVVAGVRENLKIRVVLDEHCTDVITAYPVK